MIRVSLVFYLIYFWSNKQSEEFFSLEQIIIFESFIQRESQKKKLFYLPVRLKWFASSHFNVPLK